VASTIVCRATTPSDRPGRRSASIAAIKSVIVYIIAGNTLQMRDKAFMAELTRRIRFNDADALATMDGLSTRASGNAHRGCCRWS
jgi:hypothetical protein